LRGIVVRLMSEVFDKAAIRHWLDAQQLEQTGRRANADHLYGFAAECAVKVAIIAATGSALSDHHRRHIEVLWDRAALQGVQKRYPTLAALLKLANPFADWSVDQRYDDGAAITAERVARHRTAARRLLGCVGLTVAVREEQQ
jgi:hypothetical protein